MVRSDDAEKWTDDGLLYPDVGSWTETKHDYVSYYAKLFSSGMKRKWNRRIYVDLYAGAGFAKIRDSGRIIAGSPIRALLLPDPSTSMFSVKRTKKSSTR
jgi:three-Cys-motif partner protein